MDVSTYETQADLWFNVEKRFNADGMYLPPEAKEHINELWENLVGVKQPETQPVMGGGLDEFIIPQPEIESIEPEFFQTQSLPEILQESPAKEQIPFKLSDIGKSFKSIFKRLFRI